MWAGGKRRLLPRYAPHLPDLATVPAYVEPFLGGGAVFAAVAARQPHVRAVLGDVNGELIRLYAAVQSDPEDLIRRTRAWEKKWLAFDVAGRKTHYYALRERYWSLPDGPESSALLYFLLKTGFNGIWQTCVAAKGRYGTPVGLANQKKPFIDAALIRQWSDALAHVALRHQPYEKTRVPQGAFVYCDPPYRGSFTSYGQAFDDDAQARLVDWCRQTARDRAALVWLSNRDTGDDFFARAAGDATVLRFPVVYTAGRRKKTDAGYEAKPAVELVLVWDGRR